MEFMDTGLPDGGGDSEAEPVLQEQPSGEVDYNNGYEGNKFNLKVEILSKSSCKILSPTDFLWISYLKFPRRIISTTATGVRFCQQRCMRWNIQSQR